VHLVVGLGNPGRKYERNRHNVGFMAVERLARSHGFSDFKDKWSGLFAKGELALHGTRYPVTVLEPQTFMNLSGDAVQPAAAFLKVGLPQIVIVHDELDLAWRDVRLKVGGGHAGHNGLRSLIGRLGAPDFVRVRVGVGRPPPGFRGEVADYVLADFDAAEAAELGDVLDRTCRAVETVIALGAAKAMNAVNGPAPSAAVGPGKQGKTGGAANAKKSAKSDGG
jgi:PTH1 family peptidyl-tRNA hydrolase